MWEAIWKLLTTPPPEIEIPFLHEWFEQAEHAAVRWLADHIISLISWLSALLLSTPSVFLESPEFLSVYRVVVLVALSAMLPVIGWIGLQSVLGGSVSPDLGPALGRLICSSVLMEIAPAAIKMAINLFNNLSAILLRTMPSITPEQILSPVSLELGMVVFVGIYIFLIVKLVLYYAYRNYALLALVALSPLVFLMWSLPGQSRRINRWVQEIGVLLTTQVVHTIQLIILVTMTVGAGGGEPGLPLLLLQVGGLLFMTKTPAWLGEYIHDVPSALQGIPLKELKNPKALLRRLQRAFNK